MAETKKKQNFLVGAAILTAAGIIVKVIGALFKIPVGKILGAEGNAIFNNAYNIFSFAYVLSTAGLPVAVSKMVSEANVMGRNAEIKRIVRIAAATFLTIGAIGMFALIFGHKLFANLIGNPDAAIAVLAIAPTLFFVALISIFRGYYQGMSNMVPTAISQIIEASGKLIFGVAFSLYLKSRGYDMIYVAAGAIAGVTMGNLLAAVYFFATKKKMMGRLGEHATDTPSPAEEVFKRLLVIAIPITLSSSVLSVTNLVDNAILMNVLQRIGYTLKETKWLYGTYCYGLYFFNLPPAIVVSLSISVIPAIAAAHVKRENELITRTVESSLRICSLLALPMAFGLGVLAEPIIRLVYASEGEEVVKLAGESLALLSCAVPFVCLVFLTNSILQSVGKQKFTLLSMFMGGVVKIVVNYTLISRPTINIYGAPVGTFFCYVTISMMNLIMIARSSGAEIHAGRIFVKPFIASALMGASAWAVYGIASRFVGNAISTVVAIGVGVVVYAIGVYIFGAVYQDDLTFIPKGEKIGKYLKVSK